MSSSEEKAHLNNKKPGKRRDPGKHLPLKMSYSIIQKKTESFPVGILKGQKNKKIGSINDDQSILRKDKD